MQIPAWSRLGSDCAARFLPGLDFRSLGNWAFGAVALRSSARSRHDYLKPKRRRRFVPTGMLGECRRRCSRQMRRSGMTLGILVNCPLLDQNPAERGLYSRSGKSVKRIVFRCLPARIPSFPCFFYSQFGREIASLDKDLDSLFN